MRFPTAIEWCVVAAIAGVLLALVIPGSDFDRTHRFPPASPNASDNLQEIAGEYHEGVRYVHSYLSILPDGRYSSFVSTCTGVCNRESGFVRRIGDAYALSPTKPIDSRLARVSVPIRWKGRYYLIPPDKMQEFCISIIDGDEPRNEPPGDYYLREPNVPVDGIPEMPEQWAAYLQENLVIGKVIAVQNGGRVKIDLGSAKGIEVGNVLAVQGRDRYGPQRLFVVTVETETCIAEESKLGSTQTPLEVGKCVVMQRDVRRPRGE